MELKQLRIFVAVAEELHFGRAAELLHMTQPALSAQLRSLEDQLGVSLVARTTRRVSLTRTGAAFLPEARATIEQAEKARRKAREVAEARATVLKIAAIDSATAGLLPEVIRAFRRAHAEVDVRVEEMLTAPALRGLERQTFDIVFGRTADHPNRFETRHVRHEPLVAVLPADHPLTKAQSISLADIAAERLILPSRANRPILTSVIEAWFARGGFMPRLVQEANERHMIVAMNNPV